jgi:hypothetical protein
MFYYYYYYYYYYCCWLWALLFGFGSLFSFLIVYTVGRTPWTGDQPIAKSQPTHRTTQRQNKHTQTSMAPLGFEPTTPSIPTGEDSS